MKNIEIEKIEIYLSVNNRENRRFIVNNNRSVIQLTTSFEVCVYI